MFKRIRHSALFLALWTGFFSCAPAYKKYVTDYESTPMLREPDYSQLEYWAAHPYKHGPADSIPKPLKAGSHKDSTVDVFFLHPTTFVSKKDSAWNADIDDADLNAKTDYTTILYQASAFNECRVFAPRYRQAHIRSYFTADTLKAEAAFDLAYEDIRKAFQYYLDHFNQGRPIVLASHSQGSTHARRLLKEFFEGKPLMSKLVVAYVVGMAIPKDYFTSIPPCRDSLQTGCIVGWRTYRVGYEPDFVKKEAGNSIVTNPLTWTTGNEYAPAGLNEGSVLIKFNTLSRHVADAQIHDDILWVHKPHFPGGLFYLSKNYHVGDINLFYLSVRHNLQTRISAFWKQ